MANMGTAFFFSFFWTLADRRPRIACFLHVQSLEKGQGKAFEGRGPVSRMNRPPRLRIGIGDWNGDGKGGARPSTWNISRARAGRETPVCNPHCLTTAISFVTFFVSVFILFGFDRRVIGAAEPAEDFPECEMRLRMKLRWVASRRGRIRRRLSRNNDATGFTNKRHEPTRTNNTNLHEPTDQNQPKTNKTNQKHSANDWCGLHAVATPPTNIHVLWKRSSS
ncbi:hypothetical protein B0T22DRAFT_80228 [Podospora appendiculata]|uniref:Uncharacterized protein n=1 Tax=Podospora appendiculata TaxID=314037 RepID=A0AAE0XJM2_9PEZI|nr:hypothetical protein B0T22DRAFT_80228 [Podospora appendiculata]